MWLTSLGAEPEDTEGGDGGDPEGGPLAGDAAEEAEAGRARGLGRPPAGEHGRAAWFRRSRSGLNTKHSLQGRWNQRVEHQNDARPPKFVVKELFRQYRGRDYQETVDATWILSQTSLEDVLKARLDCFAQFARELRAVAEGRDPDGAAPAAAGPAGAARGRPSRS